jgi:hypothetical protein
MESCRRSFSRASDRLASIDDVFPDNEVAEPDRFAVAREENYTDALLPPRALVLRRDRYDLLPFRRESRQVVPREVLRDCGADQISYFALARLAMTPRHFLAAAPLVIDRIEARPRASLIEILRIEAKHTEQFCEERNRSSYFLSSLRDKNRQRSITGNYRFV